MDKPETYKVTNPAGVVVEFLPLPEELNPAPTGHYESLGEVVIIDFNEIDEDE